jgi:hypothetical protein
MLSVSPVKFSPVNCCWSSPAQPFLISNPICTHDLFYFRSKTLYMFGNGMSSSTRAGLYFPSRRATFLDRNFARVYSHLRNILVRKFVLYGHHTRLAHPLLGNRLINKFPRRQILGKQSVDKLCKNRGGCVLCVVCATPSAGNGPMNSQFDMWHVFSVWAAPCNSKGAVFSVRGPCREDIREYGNGTVKYGRKSQGTRTREDCAGKGQRHIQKTDSPSRQRGRPTQSRT